MTYSTLTAEQQIAVHEQLLRQYESEHIRLSALHTVAEKMGSAEEEGLAAQIAHYDVIIAEHSSQIATLKPQVEDRVARRKERKANKNGGGDQ